MKPRNQHERYLVDEANKLPPMTEAQRRWAIEHLFAKDGLYLKSGEVFCQHCGHIERVLVPLLAVSLECGHICAGCGSPLKLKHAPRLRQVKSKVLKRDYGIMTTHGEHLLTRVFEVQRVNAYGKSTEYIFNEIWQSWVNDKGVEKLTGRPYSRSVFNLSWKYAADFDIKTHNSGGHGYYHFEDIFDDRGIEFYPRHRVTPRLKQYGWRHELINSNMAISCAKTLLKSNQAETMLKSGQVEVFKWMAGRNEFQVPYMYALRICNRNGYIVNDVPTYFDYLKMLGKEGRDLRNAHYVCPADLKEAHDKLVEKIARREARIKRQEDIQRAREFEEKYRATKGRFFGICFGNENIVITVVSSVADMADEGEAMHHCVFAAQYYDKADSLILSAKDRQGNRIETIELDIKTFRVLQSRGKFNKLTPQHDEILKLVNDNIGLIREVA